MLIDTHCHLNFKAFNKDLAEVIQRAEYKGVNKIIIPGAKIGSSQKAIDVARKYPSCFAAVGIHPHHSSELNRLGKDSVIRELATLIKSQKVKAIGEMGLDYYRYKGSGGITAMDKVLQMKLFLIQLDLSIKYHLPVIIHCREAFDDLLESLKDYKNKSPGLKGVFHCFSGNSGHLKRALDLSLYVGYDGNITYEENSGLRDMVKLTPPDRLVLETDAPFLTPVPFRGTRNEPAYISSILSAVAKIHHKEEKEISAITSQNACQLFDL